MDNDIPEWSKTTLGLCADYFNGYAFKPEDWKSYGKPIIRIEQLNNPKAKCDYYPGKLPSKFIIEKGDLIFSWSATLSLKIWDRETSYLNQHLFNVIPRSNIDLIFLKYLIEFYLPKLTGQTHGSTMKHITRKYLLSFEVFLPKEKKEQKKIAEILQYADDVINESINLIEKYSNIKHGLMQNFFGWNTSKSYQINYKNSLIDIQPIKWKIVELSNITRINMGQSPLSEDCNSIEGLPFLQGNAEFTDVFPNTNIFCTNPKKIAKPNEILLSVRAPVGEINIADQRYCIGRGLCSIRGSSQCDNKFLYYALLYYRSQLNRVEQGTTFKAVNYQDICQIKIRLPPLEEQLVIVDILDEINKSIKTEKIFMEKTLNIKKGLMYDLLTGKVRVKFDK